MDRIIIKFWFIWFHILWSLIKQTFPQCLVNLKIYKVKIQVLCLLKKIHIRWNPHTSNLCPFRSTVYHFELLLPFSWNKYPEMALLDHMVVPFLIFWGTFILFFVVAAPIYIPTNSAQGFPFSTPSPILVIWLFGNSQSNRCEGLFFK